MIGSWSNEIRQKGMMTTVKLGATRQEKKIEESITDHPCSQQFRFGLFLFLSDNFLFRTKVQIVVY